MQPFVLGSNPYSGGQHRGVDIGAPSAAEVRAPASGLVTFTGTVPRGGLSLTIRTEDGYAVTLVHLGGVSIPEGEWIDEGAVVGAVGPSGDPEHAAPYVHLGIRVAVDENGYIDPLLLLPPSGRDHGETDGTSAPEQPAGPAEDADGTFPAPDQVIPPAESESGAVGPDPEAQLPSPTSSQTAEELPVLDASAAQEVTPPQPAVVAFDGPAGPEQGLPVAEVEPSTELTAGVSDTGIGSPAPEVDLPTPGEVGDVAGIATSQRQEDARRDGERGEPPSGVTRRPAQAQAPARAGRRASEPSARSRSAGTVAIAGATSVRPSAANRGSVPAGPEPGGRGPDRDLRYGLIAVVVAALASGALLLRRSGGESSPTASHRPGSIRPGCAVAPEGGGACCDDTALRPVAVAGAPALRPLSIRPAGVVRLSSLDELADAA
jgi:hypothetical protein